MQESDGMGSTRFSGVFVVVPTPLHEGKQIDEAGLMHLVEYYFRSGCHGLVKDCCNQRVDGDRELATALQREIV